MCRVKVSVLGGGGVKFGEIAIFGSLRRVEFDFCQEGNGGQRKQEGFVSNIIHHTNFIEGQRSVEEECMACLWTDKYINKFVFVVTLTAVQPAV